MLDGLLGRGFSAKCKSSIKLTKTRIDVIRRKKNATQKFLKEDIADLLANGHDVNAYGRADGLITELNLLYCYDLIEKFCMCITKQLAVMQKKGECPEECREAVSSLMFAAARFSELLELRDLRHIFTEKYGNSLEYFVNQEFVEKLAAKPHSIDEKLQLMRDIAQEFSVRWDSRAFEWKMSNLPASEEDRLIHNASGDRYKLQNGMEDIVPKKNKLNVSSRTQQEVTNDAVKLCNGSEYPVSERGDQDLASHGRQEFTNDECRLRDFREDMVLKRVNQEFPSHRKEVTDDGHRPQNSRKDTSKNKCYLDITSRGRSDLGNDGCKPFNGREVMALKGATPDAQSHRRGERTAQSHRRGERTYEVAPQRDDPDLTYREKCKVNGGQGTISRSDQDLERRGRLEISDYGYRRHDHRDDMVLGTENLDVPSHQKEVNDEGYKPKNIRDDNVRNKDNLCVVSRGRKEFNGSTDAGGDIVIKKDQDVPSHRRHELNDYAYKLLKGKKDSSWNNENLRNFSRGRQECSIDGFRQQNGREDNFSNGRLELAPNGITRPQLKTEERDMYGPGNGINGQCCLSNPAKKIYDEQAESLKPFCNNFIPPPYVKPKVGKNGAHSGARPTSTDFSEAPVDLSMNSRDVANERSERTQKLPASVNCEREVDGPERMNIHAKEKYLHHQDDLVDSKQKPKSSRRRHSRQSPGHNVGDLEGGGTVRRSSSCRRREDLRRGLKTLLDEDLDATDEEEKMMDRLLIHYSKKKSTHEPSKLRTRPKAPPSCHVAADAGEPLHNRGRDVPHLNSEGPLARLMSLPPQTTTAEPSRVPARSSSFKPEMLAGHVHPKLPDYDDLAARFAALRRG